MADVVTEPAKKNSTAGDTAHAPAAKPPESGDSAHHGSSTESNPLATVPGKEQLKAQRETTAAANSAEASQRLLDKKEIPAVTLELGVKPADAQQAQLMVLTQERLLQPGMLGAITPADKALPNETPEQYIQREQAKLASLQKALQEEMADPKNPEKGTWGPASQEAFQNYINWVQNKVVPGAIANLVSAGLPEPAGNPLAVPEGMSTTDYQTKVVTGQLGLNFGIDSHKIPTVQQFENLENALNWTNKATDELRNQQLQLQDKQINTAIDNMGFPKGWHYNSDAGSAQSDGTNSARASAADMIDLFSKIRRAVDVIDSNKIPVDLPPGVKITRGSDGKIEHMEIPMPQDLRQDDPRNAQILEQDRKWLQAADAKISNAMKDKDLPTLAYTDTVVPQVFDKNGNKVSAQVRLDDKGNYIDLINPATVPDSQRVSKDQVASHLKQATDSVNNAVAAMPANLQSEWASMHTKRDGSYSDSQLDFIKSKSSPEAYTAAWEHNQAIANPDGYVRNTHDVNLLAERYSTDQISKDQVAQRVKATSDSVNQAVAALPAEQKAAYAALKPGDGGAYSDDQLAFLKKANLSAFNDASEHNMALSSPDGYVKVSQNVQAQETPWFSPQNLIYTNIGNPQVISERFYKPDDLVGVRDGGSTEYINAKDLKGLQETQAFSFYGSKALVLGMDAAMIAMGGVGIAAAIEGAAALGTADAVMTGARVALTAGKGVLDLGLGLSEPLSNGYWTSRDGGTAANVRNFMFLGSMGWGMAGQGLARFSTTAALSQTKSAAQMAELVGRSGTAVQAADKVSKAIMTWGQVPMAGQLSLGLADQLIHFKDTAASSGVAADAMDQYTGAAGQAPHGNALDGAPSLTQNAEQTGKDLLSYRAAVLQEVNSPYTKQVLGELFDRAGKLVASGSDAEKEAFKQTLAQNLEFNSNDLRMIEQMNGGKLSQDQLKQLMDPTTRDSFPNKQVKEYADYALNRVDANTRRASEVILLAMSRDKDGKLTDTTTSRNVTVDAYSVRETVKGKDIWGHDVERSMGRVVSGEQQNLSIDPQMLMSQLKNDLSKMKPGSSGELALSDELVKAGGLTARQYGAVLQDVLNNKSMSDSDKMALLANNNGVSFGAVLLTLNEQAAADKAAIADGSMTPQMAAAQAARNYGTNAEDLQKSLADAAANSSNPDFKAMASALLYAAKRSIQSREEGAGIMDGIGAMYQQFQKNGSHAGDLAKMANKAIQTQLLSADKTDSQSRLDAADALLATKSVDDNTNKMITQSLAETFSSASSEQKLSILKDLMPDRFKQVSAENPALASEIVTSAMKVLDVDRDAFNSDQQTLAVSMMQQLPALLASADNDTKGVFQNRVESLLDGDLPAPYSDLKAATMQALTQLGSQDNVPLLEKLARHDADASVRGNALQALHNLNDPKLAQIVESRLAKESDVNVQAVLHDLKYELDAKAAAGGLQTDAAMQMQKNVVSELNGFISNIDARYPNLAKIDKAEQSKWIAQNFPLLNHDTFEQQARLAVKERDMGWFTSAADSAKQAADKVADQRNSQFQQLLGYATMDPVAQAGGVPELQQKLEDLHEHALAVIGSIIASQGNNISPANSTFWTQQPRFRSSGIQYQETAPNWSAQAAEALKETAQAGRSQRDLAARYISMGLAAKPSGETKAALLQAWKDLNTNVNGSTAIPADLFNYLQTLNS